jgi:heme oxygenase
MLLKEIRGRTAENHTRLENNPLLTSFAHQQIDPDTYLKILVKFFGYFHPLERIIGAFPEISAWLPDYTERRKAELLLNDINTLRKNTGISLCEDLPQIRTPAQAFGSLYVMEGSTLGGKFIYSVVSKELNLDKTSGASFFYGYGPETGARWKAFGAAMEAFGEAFGADEEIITAANETFLKLEQWMQTQK